MEPKTPVYISNRKKSKRHLNHYVTASCVDMRIRQPDSSDYKNIDAANDTLAKVRERRSDGFIVQADVNRTDDIRGMMDHVKSEFGKLDIFVSNARPEIPEFYKPPMEIRVEQWQQAINSQATAFLLGAQLAAPLMGRGGRIIAITHSPGARSGSWQPWVGMGSAKAAMESLVRYFAVALARRGITVNSLSPGVIVVYTN